RSRLSCQTFSAFQLKFLLEALAVFDESIRSSNSIELFKIHVVLGYNSAIYMLFPETMKAIVLLYLKITIIFEKNTIRQMKKYNTLLGKKEVEFIESLQKNKDVRRLYKPPEIRQLKYRLLYKRKVLTNDLITLNAVLEKLQSL